MVCHGFKLSEGDFSWFGDRLTESHTGRVIIPSYLYRKFKKIYGDEHLSNDEIKFFLINRVYNIDFYREH